MAPCRRSVLRPGGRAPQPVRLHDRLDQGNPGNAGFLRKHNIVSDIEIIRIQDINEAFERVVKSDVRYRFVIDMAFCNAREKAQGVVTALAVLFVLSSTRRLALGIFRAFQPVCFKSKTGCYLVDCVCWITRFALINLRIKPGQVR